MIYPTEQTDTALMLLAGTRGLLLQLGNVLEAGDCEQHTAASVIANAQGQQHGGHSMNTPANGHKNAPQPRPASPAPITPPSRKTSPVVQSLQVMALYAALVAVVCLLVTTCSTTTQHPAAALKQGGQP